MSTLQKVAMGVVGIAFVTTLVLPKRETAKVIGALDKLGRGLLGTAMGTARAA